jgi:hypothetical protein
MTQEAHHEQRVARSEGLPPLSVYEDEPAALRANGTVTAPTPTRAQASTAPEDGRVIPAEQSVIGSVMLGAAWAEVARIVQSRDYTPQHRLILEAIAALAIDGQPHDPVTVAA